RDEVVPLDRNGGVGRLVVVADGVRSRGAVDEDLAVIAEVQLHGLAQTRVFADGGADLVGGEGQIGHVRLSR
ncbi:hypothetical protein LTR94_038183, partial [Friedmanniomyces endolithicus]